MQQEQTKIIPAHSTHEQQTIIKDGIEKTVNTIIHHPEIKRTYITKIGSFVNLTPFKESSFPILPSSIDSVKHVTSSYDNPIKSANRSGEDILLAVPVTIPNLRLNPKSIYNVESIPGGETYFLGTKLGSQFIFNLEGRSPENIKNDHIITEQHKILDLSTPAYVVGTAGIIGSILYGLSNSGKLF